MLTPETIASRRFDKQMGGYKQDEVEAFLQQVAAEYARVLREKEELEQKIEVLADKVEQYREDEDSLRSALIGAQKLGDSVIRDSKAKADYILRDAREKANQILENAQKSIEKEQMALIKMQKEVTKFKNRLLTLYRQHLEMISALPEYDEEPQPQPEPMEEPIEEPAMPAEPANEPAEPQHEESFEQETMIDFGSALEENIKDTAAFAAVSTPPAPAARTQNNFAFGGAAAANTQNSAESRFGPLKFGEGFDVERDSAAKGGLFSRKKHR